MPLPVIFGVAWHIEANLVRAAEPIILVNGADRACTAGVQYVDAAAEDNVKVSARRDHRLLTDGRVHLSELDAALTVVLIVLICCIE